MKNINDIKKMVLAECGIACESENEWSEAIEHYEDCDYLTENTSRNGHECVWYADENHNVCYDLVDDRFLHEEEIEEQFL